MSLKSQSRKTKVICVYQVLFVDPLFNVGSVGEAADHSQAAQAEVKHLQAEEGHQVAGQVLWQGSVKHFTFIFFLYCKSSYIMSSI